MKLVRTRAAARPATLKERTANARRRVASSCAAPDLATLSVMELAQFVDVARASVDHTHAILNTPYCTARTPDGSAELTAVGRVVQRAVERHASLRDAYLVELERRTPADEVERDLILCVRLQHELAINGRVDRHDTPTLLAEAVAAWG